MKYKAVIFDLFGTLVHVASRHESENSLRHMASVLSVPPDTLIQLWHDTFDQRMNGIFQDYQECIRFICDKLGVSPEDRQIDLAARVRFEMTKKEVMTLKEDAVEVLNTLRSQGFKTGLISNASIEATTVWEDTPLRPLIDVAVFSCSVGLKKPDPHIYQIAVKRLEVSPRGCMYIADGIDQELAVATKLGMHALMIRMPNAIDDDPYREEWNGPVISSLMEIMTLLN